MAADLFGKYIWIVDTLTRYGHLTREQLNEMWMRTEMSGGNPIPPRTFYYIRRAVEQTFHISIGCDSMRRYYIESSGSKRDKAFSNWLFDSYTVSNALRETGLSDGRIVVEDIPSAREFLPIATEAIRANRVVSFTYAGFNRSRAESGITFRPYLLKLYKQRWYMTGLKERDGELRTYALDRVREMQLLPRTFTPPAESETSSIFDNIIGITSSKAQVRVVKLKADARQAKYFRALPLHHSQHEMIHDDYSIFTFRLKLNYELVHEILACGPAVEVLAPEELKVMVADELRKTLALYDTGRQNHTRQTHDDD